MTTRAANRQPAHILLLVATIVIVLYVACMIVALSQGERQAPIQLRVIFGVLGISAFIWMANWMEDQIWEDRST